jgi:hypothetical protein
MTQALAEKQEGMEETLSQLDERVSEQESQLVESRLETLAVREKMDEYMQLTAELGEEVSKLKVELTYAKDMDEELSEPPDRVVPAHTNGSNSTREKHSRRQSTGTNAPDTFFTSDDLRGGDELTRQGQDGVAQTLQPFFLVPPQLNRTSTNKASILKKKKTNGGSGGGGDDPDDDPDDGRRGNNKRDKDEDSDDEDSWEGRKKEGRTAEYLDSIIKKPAMVSPAKLRALAGTPATGFAPAGYFPYAGTP